MTHTQPPLTRREIRERERAAERAAKARHVPSIPQAPHIVESAQGITVAHPHVRLTPLSRSGLAKRVGLLAVLGIVTVLAPLAGGVVGFAPVSASVPSLAPTPTTPVIAAAPVAAGVLGNDVDVPDGAEAIANVPDAATRARIREAYENAAVTCAPQSAGASGDTSAFTTTPEVFYPMMPGSYTLSSEYGWRIHPTMGYSKFHAGQDMAAPTGTPIYAVAAGTVVEAGMTDGTGTVTIKHEIDGQTWYTSYLHMYSDGIYVHVGEQVSAGQLIAGVGSTGYSTGAHLHFEVRTKNDSADSSTVDPMAWLVQHHAVELTTHCS
ncbi:M23 family metallopeptidase [Actinomyces vulturis]|uniref:M23 family metallopeptidase n=1 Tax=Actinomyces vulturis TaxID=1857645 RepID=UPI00082F9377|nr:M23 family metallopeptidase [Actinomyces vulturis]